MDSTEKRNFICRLSCLAAMGAVLLLWVWMDWPCLVRSLTGIPCPGCGLSRAWLAALKLQLGEAFRMHPMFWSLPVLALVWLVPGKKTPGWVAELCVAIAIGYVVCYIIRLWAFLTGAATI